MPGSKFNQIKGKDPIIETFLSKVSKVESGDNPNAKNPNGTAMGLFQFTEGTWKGLNDRYGFGYNLEDRKNPEKSANVMRQFTLDNEKVISPVVGRELNDADRYMAHFLGSGGAKKFFTAFSVNPSLPISSIVSSEALKSNKSVFYNKDGTLKTLEGVYDWARNKMEIKAQPKVYTPTGQIKTEAYKYPEYRLALVDNPASLDTSTTAYIEPAEEDEPQQIIEAKQDIAEKSFIQDLGNIFSSQQQAPVQQNEEIVLDPSAYNYINMEEYQNGGKKPYITNNPNDPRIQAYKDSLTLYNVTKKQAQELKNANSIPDALELFESYANSKELKNAKEARKRLESNNRAFRPKGNYVKYYNYPNNRGREEFYIDKFVPPNQEVILTAPQPVLQVRNKSRVNFLNSNDNLISLSDTEVQAPTDIMIQEQLPTFNISEQNQRMNGMTGYGTGRQDNEADIDKALRALEYTQRYNQYIEDTYNNPESRNNPKAQERYNTLKNNINITPNTFRRGGKPKKRF